jgi:lipopolysaccharide transport system ATP-binding protein
VSIITADKVTKKFKIPHEKKSTMLHKLIGIVKRQFDYEEFLALNEVSFEIEKGKTFGIIGRNGSGKSTLLKILAKVMYPDSGSVTINGKTASFLELGVGFQPELSAKENVYLYASILGMGRKEVDKKYDEIFNFSELKKFENMKLKNFSSGMSVRLAFSTAIQMDPDILLIDEVFAVGDETFQKKCTARMNEFKKQGKAMVFVSHALGTVRQLCDSAILIDGGKIIAMGNTEDVITKYLFLINSKGNEP